MQQKILMEARSSDAAKKKRSASLKENYKNNPEIKWNFTKFVVDREGNVAARFEPTEDMKKVDSFVASLL